jgi:SAM-dependent methyltransferase
MRPRVESPCPACGAASASVRLYSKNECDIYRCAGCGLGSAEAGEFDATKYYDAGYFSGGRPDGYGDYEGSEPILRREFRRLTEIIHEHVAGGRLLEIGCAYGFFLKEARKKFTVTGVEISSDAVDACHRAGLDVVHGVLDTDTIASLGNFDVIVMLDVIEHLPDPEACIRLCSSHLNRGGVLVMTTGDFASAVARATGKKWRLMTPPQHMWFFTPSSLRKLGARHGLAAESIGHPWKLVPLSLIAFQLRRLGLQTPRWQDRSIGIPVNLFDAMRVVFRKQAA